MKAQATLLVWLWQAQWREQPGRTLCAALTIAVGVALALAVHLVNRSALTEFAAALALVNGQAQAQLLARTDTFDESLYPLIARQPGIEAASPVLEVRLPVRGTDFSLRILGIDPLRAAQVTPGLLPSVGAGRAEPTALFADDAIFLSRAAAKALGLAADSPLTLLAGDRVVELRVAGSIDAPGEGQWLAAMDIGAMQASFGRFGRLSRIDLRFAPDADIGRLREAIESGLPTDVAWSEAQAAEQRMSNLSRAYRVNLNVLALVALFTGAFIVQAALNLLVTRQQAETALLGMLGAERRLAAIRVAVSALAIGVIGAFIGVMSGLALAQAMLSLTGGDLGGGYFAGTGARLSLEPVPLLVALGGGIGVALAGAIAPMRAARAISPARAIRAGSIESALSAPGRARLGLLLAAAAGLLLQAPPVSELPLPAYAAIALLLLAGVLLVHTLLAPFAAAFARLSEHGATRVVPWLAAQRLVGAPASAAAALGGVVASFALASAMAIMVTSFRVSVSQWLDEVLPADLYARTPAGSTAAGFGPDLQHRLAAQPGVRALEFTRLTPLLLDARRPPVMLIARPLHTVGVTSRLPLVGAPLQAPPGETPVWVTEAMVDLYGLRPGDRIDLPLAQAGRAEGEPPPRAFIAGVWRDYSRQHGAIAIDLTDYRRLHGDELANEIAWWLEPGVGVQPMIDAVRKLSPIVEAMEFRETAQLKALSLRIFDRSFAITHALEAIAIAVALFGIVTTVAGEALARAREFGMLRHLGLTRSQIGRQFAIEALTGCMLAVIWGLGLGVLIAWILVHKVNPQSFHWTMDLHWPIGVLAASALTMLALAALAARLAARDAMGSGPVRAVREDW